MGQLDDGGREERARVLYRQIQRFLNHRKLRNSTL